MNKGIWIWPSDQNAQRVVLRKVADTKQLVSAMAAIAKSKEGLSNSELDDAMGDSSEWLTLNVVRQLTSLGFVEFKVDFFGGPARYQLTDRGRSALSMITGKPVQPPQQKPPAPPPTPSPAPQAATPKAA